MTTLDSLRNQLQALLDTTETKEAVAQIGITNGLADKLEEEHKELQAKYDDLFKDYRELVKHTSFAPTGNEEHTAATPDGPLTFESFLETYRK